MISLTEEAPATAAAESCSLDHYLSQPDDTPAARQVLDARIVAARAALSTDVVLLGHHYQRDEVIRFADYTGDSYKLSRIAADTSAKYMLFCGVHFMAETADILAKPWQQVILPDLNAGCSMADMAEIGQVEDCWGLARTCWPDRTGRPHPAHLHELRCQHQGLLRRAWRPRLHFVERSRGL